MSALLTVQVGPPFTVPSAFAEAAKLASCLMPPQQKTRATQAGAEGIHASHALLILQQEVVQGPPRQGTNSPGGKLPPDAAAYCRNPKHLQKCKGTDVKFPHVT